MISFIAGIGGAVAVFTGPPALVIICGIINAVSFLINDLQRKELATFFGRASGVFACTVLYYFIMEREGNFFYMLCEAINIVTILWVVKWLVIAIGALLTGGLAQFFSKGLVYMRGFRNTSAFRFFQKANLSNSYSAAVLVGLYMFLSTIALLAIPLRFLIIAAPVCIFLGRSLVAGMLGYVFPSYLTYLRNVIIVSALLCTLYLTLVYRTVIPSGLFVFIALFSVLKTKNEKRKQASSPPELVVVSEQAQPQVTSANTDIHQASPIIKQATEWKPTEPLDVGAIIDTKAVDVANVAQCEAAYCSTCGSKVETGSRFCRHCGAALLHESQPRRRRSAKYFE